MTRTRTRALAAMAVVAMVGIAACGRQESHGSAPSTTVPRTAMTTVATTAPATAVTTIAPSTTVSTTPTVPTATPTTVPTATPTPTSTAALDTRDVDAALAELDAILRDLTTSINTPEGDQS